MTEIKQQPLITLKLPEDLTNLILAISRNTQKILKKQLKNSPNSPNKKKILGILSKIEELDTTIVNQIPDELIDEYL